MKIPHSGHTLAMRGLDRRRKKGDMRRGRFLGLQCSERKLTRVIRLGAAAGGGWGRRKRPCLERGERARMGKGRWQGNTGKQNRHIWARTRRRKEDGS